MSMTAKLRSTLAELYGYVMAEDGGEFPADLLERVRVLLGEARHV